MNVDTTPQFRTLLLSLPYTKIRLKQPLPLAAHGKVGKAHSEGEGCDISIEQKEGPRSDGRNDGGRDVVCVLMC